MVALAVTVLATLATACTGSDGGSSSAPSTSKATDTSATPARPNVVLVLLDVEERSVAEVAAVTGWNQALVKVRAFRARQKMKAQLEKIGAETTS